MAESERKSIKKHGGRYCVAGGPNNVSCTNTSYTEGVSMHVFPKDDGLRKKWTRFVQIHRANFTAKPLSALCSAHFEPSFFERNISLDLGASAPSKSLRRFLKKGSIPTIDCAVSEEPKQQTSRDKRKLVREVRTLLDAGPGASATCRSTEDQLTIEQPEPEAQRYFEEPENTILAADTPLVCDKCPVVKAKLRKLQKKCSRIKKRLNEMEARYSKDSDEERDMDEDVDVEEENTGSEYVEDEHVRDDEQGFDDYDDCDTEEESELDIASTANTTESEDDGEDVEEQTRNHVRYCM